jgi:beta-glucosidase
MRARLLGVSFGVSLLVFGATAATAQPNQPWMNSALSPDARADLVQAQMTRDEELILVDGYLGVAYPPGFHGPIPAWLKPLLPGAAGYVPGIARLGIPALTESDASLGVANGGNMRPGDTAVALPSSLLTAATYNPSLAFESGAMVGREARAKGFNVMLAGGVNLAREPRNGRTFEYAGEDPLLAGIMVGDSIKGIQSQAIISTAKHFAFNDQETARTVMSVAMEEGEARESDLLAFEIALERGDPGAIMCSYNRYKNVYACENPYLLNDVLRSDWGYKGFVLSDWGAVHSTVAAVTAGLDQESSNGSDARDFFGNDLREAIAKGEVPETRLHQMVHRILRTMFAKGLFDRPVVKSPIDVYGDLAVAQKTAEEGIVLLRNDANRKGGALLPLDPKKRQKIVVIGGFADRGVLSGGGSSQVHGIGHSSAMIVNLGGGRKVIGGQTWQLPRETGVLHATAPLAEIKKLAPKARVGFVGGEDIAAAVAAAKKADVAIVFAHQYMHEGADVIDLALPGHQNELIAAVAAANPNTIVVLETGGPVTMPWLDSVAGVLEAWYPGNGGGAAIARILFGEVNPSGKLPITFPLAESQLPHPIITGQRPDKKIIATTGSPTAYDVIYQEGARVGYRWFEDQKLTPLFPFGYGLSYTTFAYENLKLTGATTIKAEFDVRNTGTRPGKTVAQVYVKPPFDTIRLIGFEKVELAPGETKHVTVYADRRLLALFDADANEWHVAEGDYVVRLGGSATDRAALGTVHVMAGTVKP